MQTESRTYEPVIDLRDERVQRAVEEGDTGLLIEHWSVRQASEAERHRLARVIGLALLIVLNALDIISTQMFLERGLQEGNPLADALIQDGSIGWVKSFLLLVLGIRVLNARPRLATTCALWFVTGIYAAVVSINFAGLVLVS